MAGKATDLCQCAHERRCHVGEYCNADDCRCTGFQPQVPARPGGQSSPLESRIVASIKKRLETIPGVWLFKTHGGPMQVAGVPDLVGAAEGRFFALEVKRPGCKPTAIQEKVMRDIAAAGGLVAVVTSADEAEAVLRGSTG